jgi:hypothetical protein
MRAGSVIGIHRRLELISGLSGKILTMGVVAWTPAPLILAAVLLLEDAVNAAQVQR